jgi:hypothetical protein
MDFTTLEADKILLDDLENNQKGTPGNIMRELDKKLDCIIEMIHTLASTVESISSDPDYS